MKNLFKFSLALFMICFMNSCNNDDDDDNSTPPTSSTTTYKATLNGSSEVPANASTATGMATLVYNNSSKVFNITVTYTGMTATNAHIHKGAVGVSGPPVFPFTSFTSPIYFTSTALDATQIADLNANLYYVNLHSTAYPDGEIRGQLIKQTTSAGGGGY